jgi:nitronate monooxygenase
MTAPFKTRITDLFGIRLPIVAGCMQHLSTPEYVAAVASAGMVGFLAAASFGTQEALRIAIRRCRELTEGRPFGVNISMLPKLVEGEKTEQFFEVILDEGVRFVETSGRSPERYLPRLQAGGVKVVHKVPAVKYARKAQSLGVDAVAVVGAECGGHPGGDLVGTMVQTAVAARDLSIPLIVGGGIGTGAQLVAALAMGADGVVMGTRFLVAEEIWAHRQYKEQLMAAEETDTTLVLQSLRNTMRVLNNGTAREVQAIERAHGGDLARLLPHISGAVGRLAYETGETSRGALAVGQAVAFANRIEPLATIVKRIEDEAEGALQRLTALTV